MKTIGVVKDDKKDTYQDSITAPLNREWDDSSGGDGDGLEEDSTVAEAPLTEVLTEIPYVPYWTSCIGLGTNIHKLTSAQKYYLGCAFKPSVTGGIA